MEDPIDPSGTGNTKQSPPSKRWCFTLNNYDEKEYEELITYLRSNSSKFIVGKEVGEEGTPHLQGYVNLDKKMRFTQLAKHNKRIHWEKCKGTEKENIAYCSKEGDYLTNGLFAIKPLKVLAEKDLYKWQLDIIDIIKKEPDDRKIYWFWEPDGNIGKTTFCKYLSHYYNAVPVEGKKNDILYCAAEYESDLYVFDFERSMEEYISYGGIEKIKNGYYMCSKYESKPIIRNCPHIICFANFEPDEEKLSSDRWVIKKLKKPKE